MKVVESRHHQLLAFAALALTSAVCLSACSGGSGSPGDSGQVQREVDAVCKTANSQTTTPTSFATSTKQQFQNTIGVYSQVHASDETLYSGLRNIVDRYPTDSSSKKTERIFEGMGSVSDHSTDSYFGNEIDTESANLCVNFGLS